MVCNHWCSSTGDVGEFERSVESIRALQITDAYDSRAVAYVVAGDMNDDITLPADTPKVFLWPPSGLPSLFSLGRDLFFPIDNGVFLPMQRGEAGQALKAVDAFQTDGDDATHVGGGRIDYLWTSAALRMRAAEVYDSNDEGLGGLPKAGDPLPKGTSAIASDHLPVFVDLEPIDALRSE
jgi:endonuclease/exonuclease/phosphatase family metal-dependent hydrolase